MIDKHKIDLFKQLFSQAESVFVVYPKDALRDHLFTATALYKTFSQIPGKVVSLLGSEDLSKIEADITYLDETKTEIGHKNLCISLDYSPEKVEKITSAIDETTKKIHITIKPQNGTAPIAKETVSFSYTGAQADMVILVGVDDLEALDNLYLGYENVYQNTALVSLNSYETSFGNLKLDIMGSSCLSEYATELLRSLELPLDNEVATNLLAGIEEETEKLESYLATADTFDVVAHLLRSGARRFARSAQKTVEMVEEVDLEIAQAGDSDDMDVAASGVVGENGEDEQSAGTFDAGEIEVEKMVATAPDSHSKAAASAKASTAKAAVKPLAQKLSAKKPGDLKFSPSGLSPSSNL